MKCCDMLSWPLLICTVHRSWSNLMMSSGWTLWILKGTCDQKDTFHQLFLVRQELRQIKILHKWEQKLNFITAFTGKNTEPSCQKEKLHFWTTGQARKKILTMKKAGRHGGLSCGKKITGKSPQMFRSNKMWKKLVLKQLSRTKRYIQGKSNCGEGFFVCLEFVLLGEMFVSGFVYVLGFF